MSVTPNAISQASIIAAALAGISFWLAGQSESWTRGILMIGAALFCQLRLLCNLFDGLVAMEGGKAAADGQFWNEFPDRVADLLIFVGAGYAVAAPELGWAVAALAILAAYVRELGHAMGFASDFSGPMAKQHRMATLSIAAGLSAVEPLWNGRGGILHIEIAHMEVLHIALWIIAVGTAVTVLRRSRRLVRHLNGMD
jgi:phosphatidylglycerophosphate synthase